MSRHFIRTVTHLWVGIPRFSAISFFSLALWRALLGEALGVALASSASGMGVALRVGAGRTRGLEWGWGDSLGYNIRCHKG